MTYEEVLDIVYGRADCVSAFIVVREGEDLGVFWGTFSMSWRGRDLTEELADECGQNVRAMAALVATARVRQEAKGKGLEVA